MTSIPVSGGSNFQLTFSFQMQTPTDHLTLGSSFVSIPCMNSNFLKSFKGKFFAVTIWGLSTCLLCKGVVLEIDYKDRDCIGSLLSFMCN